MWRTHERQQEILDRQMCAGIWALALEKATGELIGDPAAWEGQVDLEAAQLVWGDASSRGEIDRR